MSTPSWRKYLSLIRRASIKSKRGDAQRNFRRLHMEGLENRLLLTESIWEQGGTTSNWGDQNNWCEAVPSSGSMYVSSDAPFDLNSSQDTASLLMGPAQMLAAASPLQSPNRTLTVIVHGFQAVRDIPAWAERIAKGVQAELEKYVSDNATFYVSWDGGSSSNETPATQVAGRIVDFLKANEGVWDVLLVGHSRGGLFVNKVLDKLNTQLSDPTRLGYVEQILLDPTGATPFQDFFPTATPALADRTIDYHDDHTLLNGVLSEVPYFGTIRKVINFLGREFPNGWLADFQQRVTQFASITLDSDSEDASHGSEASFTLGESRNVHDDFLQWPGHENEFRISEAGTVPTSIYSTANGLGQGVHFVAEYLSLVKSIDDSLPAWLKSSFYSGIATGYEVAHSIHMHTNIHDWWTETRLTGDVQDFIRAKTGWSELASHVVTENPEFDIKPTATNTWKAYSGSLLEPPTPRFDFPSISDLPAKLAEILREGVTTLHQAGVGLPDIVKGGFSLSQLANGSNVTESIRTTADAAWNYATSKNISTDLGPLAKALASASGSFSI
ncbi:MAG: hypothetical protein ACKPEY_03820, partial [Planctomycetota bacterium]